MSKFKIKVTEKVMSVEIYEVEAEAKYNETFKSV
jgi:hypothetical protein